jgi:hypothetical protein
VIFKTELIDKIVCGEKTQTRRPVKDGEVLRQQEHFLDGWKPVGVLQHGRAKVMVGRDYAVVPGRGQAGIFWHPEKKVTITKDAYAMVLFRVGSLADGFMPLRIRVLDIRREDVRKISLNDAIDEGFDTRNEFWEVWCGFYDKPALEIIAAHKPHNVIVQAGLLQERPDELYQAWAYTFEIVRA